MGNVGAPVWGRDAQPEQRAQGDDRGDQIGRPAFPLAMLVVLFVFFRLMAIFFLAPGGRIEPGVELLYYRRVGELSLEGYYPFLHYWFEYPPVFPWLAIGIYRLSLLLPSAASDLLWFQAFFGAFLLACDVGNLLLVHGLSRDLGGQARAGRSALLYAGFFLPFYSLLNWFDVLPLFFLLLATWLCCRRRMWLAGLATGAGFMIKLIPLVAAPAALRYFGGAERRKYALATAGSVLALAAPFLLHDPQWLIAGFRATIARASWETIWALAEGYYGPGDAGAMATRFDPAMAGQPSHPATLPWPLINAAFVAGCLLLFWRRPATPVPKAVVAAVGLTLNLLLLFSKGYSPQYLVYPLAFLSIMLADRWGVAYGMLLVVTNFVEYPVYFTLFPDQHWLRWNKSFARAMI